MLFIHWTCAYRLFLFRYASCFRILNWSPVFPFISVSPLAGSQQSRSIFLVDPDFLPVTFITAHFINKMSSPPPWHACWKRLVVSSHQQSNSFYKPNLKSITFALLNLEGTKSGLYWVRLWIWTTWHLPDIFTHVNVESSGNNVVVT